MMLLSGNEAIALGAYDASCRLADGYPGTPSTETLEYFAKLEDTHAEWCTNEKVALEVAVGSSCGGERVLVTMKHVGLNVAADPLFTAAYTGVGGGLVLLVADDPGMHSSQNEQDTRYYGLASKIPVLEPADSQEAYDMAREAFRLSEKFDVPVIIRSTVRISHTKTPVEQAGTQEFIKAPYESRPDKWVMMPLYAKARRKVQLERIERLREWCEETDLNKTELRGMEKGIICSGAVYQHVREALPDTSVLKLGVSWPLPAESIRRFAEEVDQVIVIEEASTYLREGVSATGIEVSDAPYGIPLDGELDPETIRQAFTGHSADVTAENIIARPPALCPGCPHRLVFKELSRMRAIVMGDIGCYTLGALPPLSSMDACIDMGASISMAHGMELAIGEESSRPIVGIIGDSTFAHSGIESLASTAYNAGSGIICILDNRTTAMTGRQGNPFNGIALYGKGECGNELDLAAVASSIGADSVETVDPNDMSAVRESLKRARAASDELSVIIFKSPCILLERRRETPYMITACTGCGVCLTLGCPAIGKEIDNGLSYIDAAMCVGCGQCSQYCRFDAIVREV